MSVLDGKLVVKDAVTGSSYTVQTPPHAEAPTAQNQAFLTALAAKACCQVFASTPTASLATVVGQLAFDATNTTLYVCTAVGTWTATTA